MESDEVLNAHARKESNFLLLRPKTERAEVTEDFLLLERQRLTRLEAVAHQPLPRLALPCSDEVLVDVLHSRLRCRCRIQLRQVGSSNCVELVCPCLPDL